MKISNKIIYTSLTLIALFSKSSYATSSVSTESQCPKEIQFSNLPARFNDVELGRERFANPDDTIQMGSKTYKIYSVSLSSSKPGLTSRKLEDVITRNHLLTVDRPVKIKELCKYTKSIQDKGLDPVDIIITIEK